MSEVVRSLDIMEFAVELARTGQSYALATVVWRCLLFTSDAADELSCGLSAGSWLR